MINELLRQHVSIPRFIEWAENKSWLTIYHNVPEPIYLADLYESVHGKTRLLFAAKAKIAHIVCAKAENPIFIDLCDAARDYGAHKIDEDELQSMYLKAHKQRCYHLGASYHCPPQYAAQWAALSAASQTMGNSAALTVRYTTEALITSGKDKEYINRELLSIIRDTIPSYRWDIKDE